PRRRRGDWVDRKPACAARRRAGRVQAPPLHASPPEHLAEVFKAGFVDAADGLDGVALGGAGGLELTRPFDGAALAVLVLGDMDRGVVLGDRQRALQDGIAVGTRLVVLAVELLDDLAAAVERERADGGAALLRLLAL